MLGTSCTSSCLMPQWSCFPGQPHSYPHSYPHSRVARSQVKSDLKFFSINMSHATFGTYLYKKLFAVSNNFKIIWHLLFKNSSKLICSVVLVSGIQHSDSVRHKYVSLLFRFFSLIGYYKILNIVPCRSLMIIWFICIFVVCICESNLISLYIYYRSVYMLI